jgi:hypothetical protein
MAAEHPKDIKGEKVSSFYAAPPGGNEVKGSSSVQQRPAMATIENDDERLLARIGYKQVRGTHEDPRSNTNPLSGTET